MTGREIIIRVKLHGGQRCAKGHLSTKHLSVPQARTDTPWENTGPPNSPLSSSLSSTPFLYSITKINVLVLEKIVSLLSVLMLSVEEACVWGNHSIGPYHGRAGPEGVAGANTAFPKMSRVMILPLLQVILYFLSTLHCLMSNKGKNAPKIQKEKCSFTIKLQDPHSRKLL